jgi:hypothetical protein
MSDDSRKEEREILYRLDERTERMDKRQERIHGRVVSNTDQLAKHDDKIQRNTTIINAVTFGLGSVVTALVAKLQGLLHFKL